MAVNVPLYVLVRARNVQELMVVTWWQESSVWGRGEEAEEAVRNYYEKSWEGVHWSWESSQLGQVVPFLLREGILLIPR